MNPWVIYALIAAGAYYVGRQKGITDQKAVQSSTNLLGQPTQTVNPIAGTTAMPGTSWAAQNLGSGSGTPGQ